MKQKNSNFDLEERTAKFGEEIISLCKSIKLNVFSAPIISQLIRSGTSVGANYMEANGASSKKDFKNKIYICKKEVQETKHWLRMAAKICPEKIKICQANWLEAQELTLIFGKIISSMK